MIDKIIQTLFGSQHERELKTMLPVLEEVNKKEQWAMALTPEEFPGQTLRFKERLSRGEHIDSIVPEAFALAREAARRTLKERPYDVQILGGLALHHGKIMEMKTGEGKTLSSVAAAYTNALTGRGVHMITVNDYLAERDAEWMKPVYDYLSVTVGAIVSEMDTKSRIAAYNKDITYGTNNEFGFDYLRDNMVFDMSEKRQREHAYCIIDEIDSILIDEARTPLIISGAVQDDTRMFNLVNQIAPFLKECEKNPDTGEYPEEPVGDFKLDEKSKRIMFTDEGLNNVEKLLMNKNIISSSLFNSENFQYVHYVTQAVRAHKLFHKDVDYVVSQDGKVEIVDEFTGRILHGRRYSEGLHQAIEAKEKIRVAQRNRTLATITFQNFFRMYDKISGMTGTADTEAKEFGNIYGLEVVVIPTNRPLIRDDQEDIIFLSEKDKFNYICDEIAEANNKGQPILVGTVSIEKSEALSNQLNKRGIRHEILNAKNHHREALIIAEAGAKGSVTIATNMAGRGTDIKLGGNPEYRARKKAGTDANEDVYRKCLAEEREKVKSLYQEIKDIGGLFVIGTERHESRRIDNQLRGRSGRQGDPGRSRFYISLDDDLMRLFGGENFKSLMSRMGMREGEPIHHGLISKSIERAQKRVEDRNYEIRKHLLDFDNVLNEQRNFIYKQRDKILADKNLKERVLNTIREITEDLIDEFTAESRDSLQSAYIALQDKLRNNFLYELDVPLDENTGINQEALVEKIYADIEADINEKEALAGKERLNAFLRYDYITNIDKRWQEHLENLEALREAVSLRQYAQKNPLLEYKLEGFQIFDTLIQNIRTAIACKVAKIKVEKGNAPQAQRSDYRAQAMHREMNTFAASARRQNSRMQSEAGPKKVQVVRNQPKTGRNDPCPCGSGKKFKHCHGS